MPHQIDPTTFQKNLLSWFQKNGRSLPWRQTQNPYHIWLSEVMLQQTTVTAVIPYYYNFLEHFPTLNHLAQANLQDVLTHWQGLGYYSRAKNLHNCAKIVVQEHNGNFPKTEAELLKLPGIGPYTAAAIAAIAFNQPATVVDGNVERVISRLYSLQTPLPQSKSQIRELAQNLTSKTQSATYAGAIMDLGATICTPKSPKCQMCPVNIDCSALKTQTQTNFPKKQPKAKLPVKQGIAWIITDPKGQIYLQQRTTQRLLHNLWEVPHTGWETETLPFPKPQDYQEKGHITHTFTHFKLQLEVRHSQINKPHPKPNAFNQTTLPPISTLMQKVLRQL